MLKKTVSMLIAFTMILSLAVAANAAGAVPEKVIHATESVVRILAKYSDGYSSGTGFVIKSDRNETLILTNYHVVEDEPYSIAVWVGEDEMINAEILAFTSQKDLCLLRLTQQVALKPASLSTASAKQGDAVYAVGFPAKADALSDTEAHTSQAATITDGIVSALREATTAQYGTPVRILQISAAINSGNSGGPLFDVKGKVVGVNTYGIADAQGIFGAIDITEIHTFLAEHGIKTDNPLKNMVLAIVVGGAAVVVLFVVLLGRKRKQKPMKTKKNIRSLRDFMTMYPEGLGVNDAVALLLPVALQLRDMHNNGKPHLQVSPDRIVVDTTARLLEPSESEADRYCSGFAAKEIYSGTGKGVLSDIYSFCAVLQYVSGGVTPVNALQRETDDEAGEDSFARIIHQGMSIRPEDRFDNMQTVILKLSEFNTKPFVPKETVGKTPDSSRTGKKASSGKGKIRTVIAIIVAVVVLGYALGYCGAYYFARTGNFDMANKCLFLSPLTEMHDQRLAVYVRAGDLMENRQYAEAKELFLTVPEYMDADNMALEAYYCHAAQLADANKFGEAVYIYNRLASVDYKDSEAKVKDVRYRRGLYIMYEEQNYLTAHNYLSSSVYDGMDNIDKIRNELKELLYVEAVAFYRDGQLNDASKRFVEGYKDSDLYQNLIKIQGSLYGWFGFDDGVVKDIEKAIENFYFEDTAEVLLSSHVLAKTFLKGNWKSTTGGKYFRMDDKGSISYNLPWFDYGDYYKIESGDMLLYPEGRENQTKTLFSFKALTPNQIQVYCHKDGSTYTLNRQ